MLPPTWFNSLPPTNHVARYRMSASNIFQLLWISKHTTLHSCKQVHTQLRMIRQMPIRFKQHSRKPPARLYPGCKHWPCHRVKEAPICIPRDLFILCSHPPYHGSRCRSSHRPQCRHFRLDTIVTIRSNCSTIIIRIDSFRPGQEDPFCCVQKSFREDDTGVAPENFPGGNGIARERGSRD